MADKAWVTLVTNDTYALGALVLAHSLKKVNTAHKLIVLVSSNVTFAMRGTLQSVYDEIREVNILDSQDTENLKLLARPELGITFTKLHCWKLTQYEKCIFLDADTLVLQNCDELFEREELSAAPDVGWPDCFNTGVFVFKPSVETFKALYDFAIKHGSFDGGDQGLLNMYFSDWATSDSSKRLPFLYNLSSAAIYSYLPAFKWYGRGVKIVHFIGNSKPWLQPFNSLTRSVEAAPGSSHLLNFLQYWWDLFCACVHPKLSPEMIRQLVRSWYTPQITIKNNPSRNNPTRNEVYIHVPFVAPETKEHFIFTDPWEEFEKSMTTSILEPSNNICVTSCNSYYDNIQNYSNETQDCNFNLYVIQDQCTNDNDSVNKYATFEPPACKAKYVENAADIHCRNSIEVYATILQTQSESQNSICDNNSCSGNNQCINTNDCETEQINVNDDICMNDQVNCDTDPVSNEYSCDIPVNNYSSSHSLKNEILRQENGYSESRKEIDVDAGLANSLAQMKLDEPTPEQKAREDFLRRQNWEHGNIDYMGKDSFNNIWEKISQTMNFEPEKPAEVPSAAEKSSTSAVTQSPENSTAVESSVPEACSKPPSTQFAEQPLTCAKPTDGVQPLEQPLSCPKPLARIQPMEQPPSCPKPPACAQPEIQSVSCPKPPSSTQLQEQSLSGPKSPSSAQPAKQPLSCPKPPSSTQLQEQPLSGPKSPSSAQPAEQPLSCPKPISSIAVSAEAPISCPKPSKLESTILTPVAAVPVAPTLSKPAVESASSTPAPVSVPPAAAAQPAPQVSAPSSAQQASPACQKSAPSKNKLESEAKSPQQVKPAPAQEFKSKPASPAKPAAAKKK